MPIRVLIFPAYSNLLERCFNIPFATAISMISESPLYAISDHIIAKFLTISLRSCGFKFPFSRDSIIFKVETIVCQTPKPIFA